MVGATGIAFVLATAQAYQNKNILLSWFLTSAPSIALFIHQYKPITTGYVFPIDIIDIFYYLFIGIFCGTTAHLLGRWLAEFRGDNSQRLSKRERLGLPVILILACLLFVYFFGLSFIL